MIIVLEGVMGSGKTYEAVAFWILPALKNGRKVITNIPLNREVFAAWYGMQMLDLIEVRDDYIKEDGTYHVAFSDVRDFRDEWRHPTSNQKPLYVVDEAHIPFETTKSDRMRELFIDASLSRRNGNDWILITQSMSNLYKPIANLVQAVHYMKKRVTMGKFDSYFHFVYDGCTRGKKYISKNVRTYDPDIFLLYKSHMGCEVDEAQMNVSDFRAWKAYRPTVIMFTVLAVLMYLVYKFLWANDDEEVKTEVKTESIVNSNNEFGAKPSKEEFLAEYYKNNPKPVPIEQSNQKSKKNIQEKGEHDKQYLKIHDDMRSNEVLNVAQVEQTVYEREPLSNYRSYKKAPFENYKIQVLGNMFNPKTKQIEFSYGVWSESGVMNYYKLAELVKMNYNIMPVSDCMQLVDHPNISEPFYITCHQPTFEKKKNEVLGNDAVGDSMMNAFKFN